MFSDLLGIIIAFSTIILLFSLLVTTGIELILGAINQRNRNLKIGMSYFEADLKKNVRLHALADRKRIAIYNAAKAIISDLIAQAPSPDISKLRDRPQEISSNDLVKSFEDIVGPLLTDDEKKLLVSVVKDRFLITQAIMSRRYQRISHKLSFVLSFILAFTYQLNTPQLLVDLSKNKERTESIISYYEQNFSTAEDVTTALSFPSVVDNAIKKLIEKHIDARELLEEVSGDGVRSITGALQELKTVAGERGDYATLEDDYNKLLQDELKNAANNYQENMIKITSDLDDLKFTTMPKGLDYYFKPDGKKTLENYIGVFISAVLISLGAPFWFNHLKTVFSIRDYFSPKGTQQQSKVSS